MFVFSKGKLKTFNPINDRKNQVTGEMTTTGSTGKDGFYKTKRKIVSKEYGRRFNIWKINPQSNKVHKAVFPEQLANDHIVSWSNEGDVILDPFMGSGTTAKMAVLNGRHYIGFEISEEYCGIAEQRLAD